LTDIEYMRLALQLAESVKGRTSPNPLVGAVVVREQRIVGMGAHLRAGNHHAEVNALNMAGIDAKGSTMYVTLEPCNHQGRTPACTERIIKEGIRKVYVAALDPNPLVAGKGIKKLEDAGIEVSVGLLQSEANKLNEVFNKYILTKMPYVILKAAMTLDGKLATRIGDSKWITNEASRLKVHQIRNETDAIMIGVQTVINDDPMLTTRLPEGGHNPIRIIIDSHLSIPETAKILNTKDAQTIIVCTQDRNVEKQKWLEKLEVKVIVSKSKDGYVDISDCLAKIGELQITSVLVEGGSKLHGSFLLEKQFDKVIVFIAPKLIGGTNAIHAFGGKGLEYMSEAVNLDNILIEQFDGDICITGYPI